MTIWLTPNEYESADLGAETLALEDGRYTGEMAVYHELHCIKRVRRHLHMDYYYPNLNGDELERESVHIGKYCPSSEFCCFTNLMPIYQYINLTFSALMYVPSVLFADIFTRPLSGVLAGGCYVS